MKNSVVMTTYNGEKYLHEQLESLQKQNDSIDELLIFDDCSTDNTCNIIKEYIDDNSIKNWRLISNPVQLGWKRNFMLALDQASGKYIFPCDQDDIWYANKIETMSNIMEENKHVQVLASNFDVRNEDPDHPFVKNMNMDGSVEKVCLIYKNFYNERPGCVYCIRKTFFQLTKHLWNKELGHDDFLWKVSFLYGGLYILNAPTIEYRRHFSNTTNRNHSKENRKEDNDSCIELLSKAKCDPIFQDNEQQKMIDKELEFFEFRKELFEKPSVYNLMRLRRYRNQYKTRKHYLGDYAFVLMPFLFTK